MQKFFRHSRKGSALLIGLVITTLLSILVIGFLDKVLRVGKNTKAIEQSTQAYYLATGIIEDKLRSNKDLKKRPWEIEGKENDFSSYSGQRLVVNTGSTTIPTKWKGNSPFGNVDYNLISLDKPVQIVIPNGINWNNVDFEFRIPEIDGKTTSLVNASQSGVILWTIGNANNALFASSWAIDKTGLFIEQDINKTNWKIANKRWYYYDSSSWQQKEKSFNSFYDEYLNCEDFSCTLKLSMLQPIKDNIWPSTKEIPFLEYRINFNNKTIPEQFMTLDATGKVANYQRTREVRIPQITTNTALDFAVLQ